MDLENLNVTELNAHEMQNTDGGLIPLLIVVAVGALVSGCTNQTNNGGRNNTNINSSGNTNTGSGTQVNTEVGVKP